MKQMRIPEEMQTPINYEDPNLPKAAEKLRPVLWYDGLDFCCLLGADPQIGIFGFGPTKAEALKDWDKHVFDRIRSASPSDELAQYVLDMLKIKREDLW